MNGTMVNHQYVLWDGVETMDMYKGFYRTYKIKYKN